VLADGRNMPVAGRVALDGVNELAVTGCTHVTPEPETVSRLVPLTVTPSWFAAG
jgi:hypothetical protein